MYVFASYNTTLVDYFQGMGNIFGSFFSCLPFAASLSRSVIQQSVGGVTQLASLINSSLILIVLLWIGPLFEPLPRVCMKNIQNLFNFFLLQILKI